MRQVEEAEIFGTVASSRLLDLEITKRGSGAAASIWNVERRSICWRELREREAAVRG